MDDTYGYIDTKERVKTEASKFLAKYPWIGIAVAIILFAFSFAIITDGNFLKFSNQMVITRAAAMYVVLGVGQTFVISTGGIDLSTSAVAGLTGALVGSWVAIGLNPFLAIIVAIIVGGVLGAFNGFNITYLKVPPLLATLGTLIAYRGIAQEIMGAEIVRNLPLTIQSMGRGMLFNLIPYPAIIAIIISLIGYFVLTRTVFGRYVIAVGSNEKAAHAARIKTKQIKILVYIIQGSLAGIASLILMGRLNSVGPQLAEGIELHVITGVILGGTYLFGGKGTIFGTILGMYLIGMLENGLIQSGFGFFAQRIVLGLLIIIAVAIQTSGKKSENYI